MTTKKPNEKKPNFVLENENLMPEIYCDGMTSLLMGKNVSKIVFHSVLDTNDDKGLEVRKAVLSLIMTTPTLLSFCKQILESAKKSSDKLLSTEENNAKIERLLNEITISSQSEK